MTNETSASPRSKGYGTGASIRLGYKRFATSVGGVCKATWPYITVFSLMCGLLGLVSVEALPLAYVLAHAVQASWTDWLALFAWPLAAAAVALVLGGLAEVATYGNVMAVLAGREPQGAKRKLLRWLRLDRSGAWRTLKVAVACLVCVAVAAALVVGLAWGLAALGAWAKSPVVSAVALGLVALVLCLLLFPLAYVAMEYVLTDGARLLPTMRRGYVVGLRHYTAVFAVCLFCAVIGVVVSYILAQPAVILGVAGTYAQLGAAQGDPLGMPSYVGWLSFAVFTLAGLVMLMVRISMLFPLRYMQQGIDAAEEERKQYRKELKN